MIIVLEGSFSRVHTFETKAESGSPRPRLKGIIAFKAKATVSEAKTSYIMHTHTSKKQSKTLNKSDMFQWFYYVKANTFTLLTVA